MDLELSFGDSELAHLIRDHDGLRLRLSAAHVLRLDGAPPGRPLAGYARGVEIVLQGADADAAEGWLGRIANGRVFAGGRWHTRVPLPFEARGGIELDLDFAHRGSLRLQGSALVCRFTGEPNHAESLFC